MDLIKYSVGWVLGVGLTYRNTLYWFKLIRHLAQSTCKNGQCLKISQWINILQTFMESFSNHLFTWRLELFWKLNISMTEILKQNGQIVSNILFTWRSITSPVVLNAISVLAGKLIFSTNVIATTFVRRFSSLVNLK